MCQGFSLVSGFLHHFVLAKLATSSIRVKFPQLPVTPWVNGCFHSKVTSQALGEWLHIKCLVAHIFSTEIRCRHCSQFILRNGLVVMYFEFWNCGVRFIRKKF